MIAARVILLLAFAVAVLPAQQPAGSPLVAFRVDGTHVVAHLRVLDDLPGREAMLGLRDEGRSAMPVARFGYRYFEPPPGWASHVPSEIPGGTRWIVHAGPGRAFEAVAERVVGGYLACNAVTGVLLRLRSEQAAAFAALPARYFVAEPIATEEQIRLRVPSSVGPVSPPAINEGLRRRLEKSLDDLLANELPRVSAESAPELARMASSSVPYHRSWAREREAIEAGLAAGRGKLRYDVQTFRLSPDGSRYYFVRARWSVDGRLGFAVSLWMRGEDLDIIWRNLRPADWLMMFEFQGLISNDHLGLVLNVLDRDGDGWGEVLFLEGGYESVEIDEFQLTPSGFVRTGRNFSSGC